MTSLFDNWNLLMVGARVRVRNTDAEPIEKHVWGVWGDDGQGFDVEVPVGSIGSVVEYAPDGDGALWVIAWDDKGLGRSLFNEPLAAVEAV